MKQNSKTKLALYHAGAAAFFFLLFGLMLLMATGCCSSSTKCIDKICPPCIKEVDTQPMPIPVTVCPGAPEIDDLKLPGFPPYPENPTEESLKSYYSQVAATVKLREQVTLEYIGMLRSIIDYYDSLDSNIGGGLWGTITVDDVALEAPVLEWGDDEWNLIGTVTNEVPIEIEFENN